MHKTESNSHMKMVVSDILSIAFQHMAAMSEEIKALNITSENIKEKTREQVIVWQTMSNMLTIINDVIHPAHDIACSLFDKDIKEFVDFCIKNQQLAIDRKLISAKCKCYSCKSKGLQDGK
jgi:uncharacterized protein YyaL (SSP411 family)